VLWVYTYPTVNGMQRFDVLRVLMVGDGGDGGDGGNGFTGATETRRRTEGSIGRRAKHADSRDDNARKYKPPK